MSQLMHQLVDSLMGVALWFHCKRSQQYIYSYPFSGQIEDNNGHLEGDIVCFAGGNSKPFEYDSIVLD